MFKNFMDISKKVKGRRFVVNAPIALRDDEFDHERGIPLHGDIKYDPSRRTHFGLTIIEMAYAFRNNMGFSLYDKLELKSLLNIMNEYVKITNASRRAINFRRYDTAVVEMVYDFGVNVIELNKRMVIDTNKDIKQLIIDTGGIDPIAVMKKMQDKKIRIAKHNKVQSEYKTSSVVKRPKPLEL